MKTTRTSRFLFTLLGSCLIFLLASCGSGGSNSGTATPTSGSTPTKGITPTSPPTTVPVPPTQTSCPPAGTARAWVTANLVLGRNQNIIYVVNEFPNNSDIGTLKRYDLTTGKKTEIIKMPNVNISEAALSSDGQWILFVANISAQSASQKLQMVRMDGQGLQTLYCNQSISNVQWSSDQKLIAFDSLGGLYLLNLTNGSVQLELKPSTNSGTATPLTWLNNTQLYVKLGSAQLSPIDTLALLDTNRGPNQQFTDLFLVYQWKQTGAPFNYPCWDADSSYDGSQVFIATCSGISAPNCSGQCSLGTRESPSIIHTKPTNEGVDAIGHTVLTSQTLGIASVRAISTQTLLLDVENFSQNHPVDTSQNGLWKVGFTGSGLARLTTEGKGQSTILNQYTQLPWSNVSRDGSMYAFETTNSGSVTYPYTYTLLVGSLSGGAPTTFASISNGTQLSIVGWTTM